MIPDDLEGIERSELPALLGKVVQLEAQIRLKLADPAPPIQGEDHGVTVEDAAGRLGMSVPWIYRNATKLPFVRRIGRRLVCSSVGIDEYLRRRR